MHRRCTTRLVVACLASALFGAVAGALAVHLPASEREDDLLRSVDRLSRRVWALEPDRRGE